MTCSQVGNQMQMKQKPRSRGISAPWLPCSGRSMWKRLVPVGVGPVQAAICARRPSNRSEVCAGMRQYMKCRRPVWRHVRPGGGLCLPEMGRFVARCVRAVDSSRDGERPAILYSFHLTCVDCLLQLIGSFAANCFSHSVAGVYLQSAPTPPLQCPGPPLA